MFNIHTKFRDYMTYVVFCTKKQINGQNGISKNIFWNTEFVIFAHSITKYFDMFLKNQI